MSEVSSRPWVVLACEVYQGLLEKYLPLEASTNMKFVDAGLHSVPKKLRQRLQEMLDAIETPSRVFLGYGLCGNGLKDLHSGKHILVVPRTDDCIAVFLGSYQAYREQFDREPGTYYLTKGWLQAKTHPKSEYEKMLEKYDEETAQWIMDQQYQHYNRLAFVAYSDVDLMENRPKAQEVAQFCTRWGMGYEEIVGVDDYLGNFAAAMKLEESTDDFLVISPDTTVTQAMFMRM